jgi:hypothetical protein
MPAHEDQSPLNTGTALDDDRRKFLAACGKFAVVTPPALTVLLSTSLNSKAIAYSGGRGDHDRGDHDRGDHDRGRNSGGEDLNWLETLLERLF